MSSSTRSQLALEGLPLLSLEGGVELNGHLFIAAATVVGVWPGPIHSTTAVCAKQCSHSRGTTTSSRPYSTRSSVTDRDSLPFTGLLAELKGESFIHQVLSQGAVNVENSFNWEVGQNASQLLRYFIRQPVGVVHLHFRFSLHRTVSGQGAKYPGMPWGMDAAFLRRRGFSWQ